MCVNLSLKSFVDLSERLLSIGDFLLPLTACFPPLIYQAAAAVESSQAVAKVFGFNGPAAYFCL